MSAHDADTDTAPSDPDATEQPWFDDYAAGEDPDTTIQEYDLTAQPNDFNISTIDSFINRGAIRIPGFQRNYVWDLKRASKLIESLLLGLPVPQVFLYEQGKNDFVVIDGQQRLMSVYYFIKGRFPRLEKRGALRAIMDRDGSLQDEVLHDNQYFSDFALSFKDPLPERPNRFKGLKYATLADLKTTFDLRTIRNVIIKQNSPADDDSSVFEMFNRLNTGGVNLTPQEIRASLHHSRFYTTLQRLNTLPGWRRILRRGEPDLHARDLEVLLRGFALLLDGANYRPSMVRFLNRFSKKCVAHDDERNKYLADVFSGFLAACADLPDDAFVNPRSRRVNVALFETVFNGACAAAVARRDTTIGTITMTKLQTLRDDEAFSKASREATTDSANVATRLSRGRAILEGGADVGQPS